MIAAEIHCRSALAREDGVSELKVSTDTTRSRASALLQVLRPPKTRIAAEIHRRSELARDRILPRTDACNGRPSSRARWNATPVTPTGFCVRRRPGSLPRSIVGARLPAKTACQTWRCRLTQPVREQGGTPPRSLLQVLRSPKTMITAEIHCRSALARDRVLPGKDARN